MGPWRIDKTTIAAKLVEVVSIAAGSAFPVGPVFDVVRAVSRQRDDAAEWFTDRLTDEIGALVRREGRRHRRHRGPAERVGAVAP